MARVIVALALAASKTSMLVRAMSEYVVTTDGCGQPCEPIDVSSLPQDDEGYRVEANTCVEVVSDVANKYIDVQKHASCAKVTVQGGYKIDQIYARSSIPFRPPHSALIRRAQVYGDDATIVIDGEVDSITARLPRPLILLPADLDAALRTYRFIAELLERRSLIGASLM